MERNEGWSSKRIPCTSIPVIPGLTQASSAADPDCVGMTANANANGGAQRERHGWRESIGLLRAENRFRVPRCAWPRNDEPGTLRAAPE